MSRPARWRGLLDATDRELGQLLAAQALALRARRGELARWAALAGLPESEVVASPFGARMIALGLEVGATTVHHELRPLVPWHPSLLPDDAVVDPWHGRWHRGALRTGKYQEFCQEDPFCAYHPEHSAKWAPHEFLHRASGFFHRIDATRLERYLGARLNELLPVATWYGLEHALRLDHEGPFDRAREGELPGASLDRARWLTESERSLRARALRAAPLVRWTLLRAASELEAIDRELETLAIVPSPDAGRESFAGVRLDASSDALAYVHAHGTRLADVFLGCALEALASTRFASLRRLRAHVERLLDRLLFAPLRLAPRAVEARILAAVPHDLFLRIASQGPAAEVACGPLLAGARRARAAAASTGSAAPLVALHGRLSSALSPVLGAGRTAEVLTLGMLEPVRSISTRALSAGLAEELPATRAHLGSRRARLVEALAEAPLVRQLLGARVAALLPGLVPSDEGRALADLARLELAIVTASGAEPRAGWSHEAPGVGARTSKRAPELRVARDARFALHRFDTDVIAAHRGEALIARPVVVALARLDDGVALVELPPRVARALEAMAGSSRSLSRAARELGGRETVSSLLEAGVLLALRAPR